MSCCQKQGPGTWFPLSTSPDTLLYQLASGVDYGQGAAATVCLWLTLPVLHPSFRERFGAHDSFKTACLSW